MLNETLIGASDFCKVAQSGLVTKKQSRDVGTQMREKEVQTLADDVSQEIVVKDTDLHQVAHSFDNRLLEAKITRMTPKSVLK